MKISSQQTPEGQFNVKISESKRKQEGILAGQ
jgi:hypothetical protein